MNISRTALVKDNNMLCVGVMTLIVRALRA